MQSVDPSNGKTFWKKNTNTFPGSVRMVYGAKHPPIIQSPKSSPKKENANGRKRESTANSFNDFQASVNDAWDCGDDEFCMISDIKISNQIAQSTALDVIHTHKTYQQPIISAKFAQDKNRTEDISCTAQNPSISSPRRSNSDESSPSHSSSKPYQFVQSKIPIQNIDRDMNREERLQELIKANKTDLLQLRKIAWSGLPSTLRPDTWKLLSGYLPANAERREETLQRKRSEYWSFVRQYFNTRNEDLHHDTYRQIHIDIPRMSPLVPLFQQSIVQEMFERILYIWAIRHPASGYVQGINDLVTPFFIVFLHSYVPKDNIVDTYDISQIDEEHRSIIEADSFWCMSKLMDGIQDNYTFAQPGIQSKVCQLRELIRRIDGKLHQHLEKHEIDYLQFSFRWFNNLLMREIPLNCIVRLWDTLHAEQDGFSHFVLYVCAAFLTHFSAQLMKQNDFQSLMLSLQNLPTKSWTSDEISIIVAEAFRLKYVFADAPSHLQVSNK